MAVLDEEGFGRYLKSGIKDNVFFIWGSDDYLKNYYCDTLVKKLVPEDMQTFNLHIYDNDETPFEEIFETAANYPMMSDYLCLLVRNYNIHKLDKNSFAQLKNKLAEIPETTVIIFYFETVEVEYGKSWRPTAWNPVVDWFGTACVSVELNPRTPEKLVSMLVKSAGKRGGSIDASTAAYFVEFVGVDLMNLNNEFDKLCDYSHGKPITRQMIDEVCVRSVSSDVFRICESLFARNNDEAFAVLNELIRIGVKAPEILGAMSSTFVNMYRMKVAFGCGRSLTDVARIFEMNKGQIYTAGKLEKTVRPLKSEAIRRCLDSLIAADMKIKRSSESDAVILTELIAKLGEVLKNA